MSGFIGTLVAEPTDPSTWSQAYLAENFVWGVSVGAERFGDCRHYGVQNETYGQATGFVYFIAAGDPIQHVKVGYTGGDPRKRLKALQTANPHKLTILGFVLGNEDYERELHDVMRDYRLAGEWFEYTPHVERIIKGELESDYL
jgi:hypothetical protein